MSNPIPNYDGSRPEPPYNTDSDAVVMLQEELDEMTADRDRLRAELDESRRELARVKRNHLRRMESACREMWHNITERKKTVRVASRYIGLRDAILATLSRMEAQP